MNKKNVIGKIKALFTEEVETSPEDTLIFVEVKTADGRILRADDIAVDMPVMEITEEGETPLEDGEYELFDGNKLVVEGGLIKEVIEAETEEEEAPEVTEELEVTEEVAEELTEEVAEVAEEVVAEEVKQPKEIIEETRTIQKYTEMFDSIKTEIEALKEENKTLKARLDKFAGEPSVESTNTTVEFTVLTKEDKLKFFGK